MVWSARLLGQIRRVRSHSAIARVRAPVICACCQVQRNELQCMQLSAALCRGLCSTVVHWVQADEDGDNMDFESLISQLFEVLITLISNRRHQELMQPIVPELIYHTIGHPTNCCIPKLQSFDFGKASALSNRTMCNMSGACHILLNLSRSDQCSTQSAAK